MTGGKMEKTKSTFSLTPEEMAKYIDHTLLKPEAPIDAVDTICDEAVRHGFKAVCVHSGYIAHVAQRLAGEEVSVCSVVGFPLGAMHSSAKAFEAQTAVECGAQELDMVLNVGALKSADFKTAEADIRTVRQAADPKTILKVIIETSLLTEEEKIQACKIAQNGGADFVKTSTGFAGGGATVADVRLMRRIVGCEMRIKASGGIKNWETALTMIKAGANRIGTSSGVAIIKNVPG